MSDLAKQYIQEDLRFRYFMIAGAAAALAYALSGSDPSEDITFSDLTWLGAVIAWGASFTWGMLGIERSNVSLLTNANVEEFIKKLRDRQSDHRQQLPTAVLEQTVEGLKETFSIQADEAESHYHKQKWALLGGAGFYGLHASIARFCGL